MELRKTSDPDGGLEWYWLYPDGTEVGWQCKFSDNEKSLMSMMDASFESVRTRRPLARRLTFCISVDLSDDPDGARGEFGWQRYEKLRTKWKEKAPDLEVSLMLGGQILERLALEKHRGREWFWFNASPILHPEWCRAQRDVAIDSAADRYRPQINVDLPIAETVAAPAQPARVRATFDALCSAVTERATSALEYPPSEGPFKEPLDRLGTAVSTLVAAARESWSPQRPLSDSFISLVEQARAAANNLQDVALQESSLAREAAKEDRAGEQRDYRAERAYRYERVASSLDSALFELRNWVHGPTLTAAQHGFLLLDGEGGAGKTHLFCDVAGQLIDEGHPVLLLLGQWFGDGSPWKWIAERIGDPGLSIDEVVVALEASAQASNRRMLLMVDALNEAGDVTVWRNHLRELRARLTNSRWVGVVLSCRTTYLEAITPAGGFGEKIIRASHPGFAGREFEAIERVFNAYAIAQPQVPLLLPEYTNPLFLILYAEGLSRGVVPTSGGAHLTAVFEAFVAARTSDITAALGLDPALNPVGKAMAAITSELVRRSTDHVPYAQASALIAKLDTSSGRWPDTLFGRMLSEGLLTKDFAFLREENGYGEAVRFPFQRFSDHVVVGRMLDEHLDERDPANSFADGQPLHEVLTDGSLGIMEALAIQLPERLGLELPTLLEADGVPPWRQRHGLSAFVKSVPARAPQAVEREKVIDLLNRALQHHLTEEVTSTLFACAPVEGHPLNANWLHAYLIRQPLARRDATWGQMTFWNFGEPTHALDRLIRWCERRPYPEYTAATAELTAIPLVWTMASPHRFARDSATKALVTLLIGRTDLAVSLVKKFMLIDDPYVTERLAAATYGALLRDDPDALARDTLIDLLEALVEMLERGRPNILLRDHVAGVARLVALLAPSKDVADLLTRALPPYGALPPEEPRTAEELEKQYPRRGPDDGVGYGSLEYSLLTDLGDFHKYVIRGAVNCFELPAAERSGSARGRHANRYAAELGGRFVFERVIELGWTPEAFGDFDASVGRADRGREAHKPERFGKKYQWIGLFELLARLADTHAYMGRFGDTPEVYEGAWQPGLRDIDPSLPPGLTRVVDGERARDPIFPEDGPRPWWVPGGPVFDLGSADSGLWATRVDDLPATSDLFVRSDEDGHRWIVLDGHLHYEEQEIAINTPSRPQRDLGFSLHAALVRLGDLSTLRTWFETKTDVMRALPGWSAQAWGESYLGELAWAPAAQELDTGWHVDEYDHSPGFPDESLKTAVPWHWPSGFDCSLDDAVNLTLPSPQLIKRGRLRRDADSLAWSADGEVVVRFVMTDEGWNRDSALIAREDWFLDLLEREELAFVAGVYGERRVLLREGRDALGWVDLGARGLLANRKWDVRGYDVLWDRRSEKDPDPV